MGLVEIDVEELDQCFELEIPEGYTITGAVLLVKAESPTEPGIAYASDSNHMNFLERVGIYTEALRMEVEVNG